MIKGDKKITVIYYMDYSPWYIHYITRKIGDKYILSWVCFAKMDFSEQYHIKGEVWDLIGEENNKQKTYKQ
jgi:hypothetical protein